MLGDVKYYVDSFALTENSAAVFERHQPVRLKANSLFIDPAGTLFSYLACRLWSHLLVESLCPI